jgi:hypothetical protein
MRFTFRKRECDPGSAFEGVPTDSADVYYPDWYPTAMETKVIAMAAAQGVSNIGIPVVYADGEKLVYFCGDCGRQVCHPACPKVVRARAIALNPKEKA